MRKQKKIKQIKMKQSKQKTKIKMMRNKTLDSGCVTKCIKSYELSYQKGRDRRRTKERRRLEKYSDESVEMKRKNI